jgi:hypothetical protein
LSIDCESNRNIVGRLAKQHLRELISDNAWPNPNWLMCIEDVAAEMSRNIGG